MLLKMHKTLPGEDEDVVFMLTSEQHAAEPTVELDTAEKTFVENQLETWVNDANAALDRKTDLRKSQGRAGALGRPRWCGG